MKGEPVIRWRTPAAEPLADHHPVVARVLAARGIVSASELDASLAGLPAPAMVDLDAATERLVRARAAGEAILVVGDFDADGATSVALAVRGLRALGYAHVDYLVPNRFDSGYGLSPELVAAAAERHPDLIVTVDNGVSCHAGVTAAKARGIDTIVTDHHLPGVDCPDGLPEAAAVVNPNRGDCGFIGKNLAGVGVVFYVLVALRARLDREGRFDRERFPDGAPALAAFLDLVALGTIADVVRLDRANRILVEQGLRRIRAGRASPGVKALLTVARRDPARIAASDLGYAIAPRLNAAGRLADMALGIETLLADDPAEARVAAERLEGLNRERRRIEAEMRAQADVELDRLRADLESDGLPAGLVLHDSRWHQGVVGILAGRVRETVHRPTVIFADAGEGSLRGSARSIPGLHMRDILAAISAARPDLIERFGGHAMAAGLTLPAAHLAAFRQAFEQEAGRALDGTAPVHEILTDGALTADELVLTTAEALRRAGPWGAGFPEPLFDGEFHVRDFRTVGEHHLKLSVALGETAQAIDAIAFNAAVDSRTDPGRRVRLVYRLEVNEYRGRRRPQLVIEHLEPLG